MRIGVLTFHSSRNFGANLQTLATQEMLRKLGQEPVVVNFVDKAKLESFAKLVSPEQVAEHEAFAKRYYNLSPELNTVEAVGDYVRGELDGVVSGSDAVFRMATPYEPKRVAKRLLGRSNPYEAFSWADRVPPYFLPFDAPGVIKGTIAASSRGTSFYYLKPRMMREVGSALRDFDFITVRDDWTARLVRWLSRGKAQPLISPDPAFGLNAAFDLPEDEKPKQDLSDVILLNGEFDEAWLRRMVAAIKARGYRAMTLANPAEKDRFDFTDGALDLPMSPLTWYASLASCAGFIGMRFHAFVSCVANNTPVVTMDVTPKRLGRGDPRNPNNDLSRRAGISDRYFHRSDLMQTDAERVLEVLFDKQTQAKADAYAAAAPDLLFGHLIRFEQLAGS
ncbi:polysaccharide pyruvyl transferase family protein [Aurantiacibacter poecillastricola]|uniref:polysaccharide pyruvyl transferase family protein n=1 Tax=Aurantiacibacter poecillastricola TaxID=3064385 RepID=UPI00273D28A9|nr:polysaccharide pyruvyl transferase family protein [Aurantiacibacter sp. 219JJ12-13]MDP5260015.1 polysaccharide pyruvyl transferase family protein [Aurantiacibacter sp. 219JJ12-13]